MSLRQRDALSDRQRRWVNAMLGSKMHRGLGAPHNRGDDAYGTVVDYKLDVAGVGVFFILDLGADVPVSHRYVERYRKLPRP